MRRERSGVIPATATATLAALLALAPVTAFPATAVPGTATSAAALPLTVPVPTGDEAVITVKVGGDRTSTTAVGPLAGVTLGLFTSEASTTPVAGFGTCVSDADGDCSFTVPGTQGGGANRDRQFWIKQTGTPAGFYADPEVGTGAAPVATDTYAVQTGTQLRSGSTYRSTADFMVGTGSTNNSASGGIWQASRANPTLPAQCGVTVGLVLDLSNSVTDAQLVDLKEAASGLVDALTGTPSRVGLFTFATSAPASAGDTLAPTSVSTAAGATAVKDRIGGYAKPGGSAGGTNWDRGIGQVALSTSAFDVAVVITDGNPTFYGNGEGPGNRTRFREVENGVFSANAVKAAGTRVLAFGVGEGASNAGSGLNLRAISGPTLGSDYYQSTDYAAAGAQLRELALGSCAGSVTVVKQVVPPEAPAGSVEGAMPQGGWTFDAAGSAGVVVDAPTSRVTADATGAANFPLTFDGGTTSGSVTLTETPQSGFALQQVGGSNAVCTRVDTGAAVPVTNVGDAGFSVTASSTYPVSCTVYNRADVPLASVVLAKTWLVDGTPYVDGEQPDALVASATVDGQDAPWQQELTGYHQGDAVTIGEDTDLGGMPLCTLDSSRLTEANGSAVDRPLPSAETLAAGQNTYTITNVVTCDTRLALTKTVQGGDADPADWTLAAIAPDGALDGPSGPTGVNAPVTPGVRYVLGEDDAHPEYVQFVDPDAVLSPGASGSWNCQEVEADGTTVIPGFQDGLNGGVTVPFGRYVRCEAVNRTATLTLAKEVTNSHGGTASSPAWDLTATPTGGDLPAGLEARTVTGDVTGTTVTVRPGVPYALTESDGPAGYSLDSVVCETAAGTTRVDTLTLAPLDTATCTFTNVDSPATLTLEKLVTTDHGGTAQPTDWTLSANGPTPLSGESGSADVTAVEVDAGTYDLAESGGPAGYTASDWTCTGGELTGARLVLGVGEDVTCRIVNDDEPATLTLVKEVDAGVTGSTAVPADWTLTATPSGIAGQQPVSGPGDPTAPGGVDQVEVFAGTYALEESGPDGFVPGGWSCQGGVVEGDEVVVPSGGNVVCTVTNTADSPTLTLRKEVVNDDGGTAQATAWTLSADGPTPVSGTTGDAAITTADVQVGTYGLTESGPSGYAASDWVCTGAAASTPDSVTLTEGQDAVCTITNDDRPGRLTLVKEVENLHGGEAAPDAWTLAAAGPTPLSGTTGADAVTGAPVSAGTYDLSESGGPSGYVASAWACEGGGLVDDAVTVALDADVTCTVTNTDVPARLTLVKQVDNQHGGTATADAWVLAADGPTPVTGATGTDAVTDAAVDAGTYDLSESGGPEGYEASAWTCQDATTEGAVPVEGGAVALSLGAQVTCTVVNSDVESLLTLVKVVVGEGAADPAAWTLTAVGERGSITGSSGSAEVTAAGVPPGDYALGESGGPSGYVAGDWVCTGGLVTTGTVTVPAGGDVTCTVTNTLPGSFDVAKSSDPPTGATVSPGQQVTYTVTATKLGGTDPTDVVVEDDLSGVLGHASLVPSSVDASVGAATLQGTTLRWEVPVLTGTQTLTYAVVVDDDVAAGTRLVNVVSSDGSASCPVAPTARGIAAVTLAAADPCSTTHVTSGPTPSPTATPTVPSTPTPPAPTGPPQDLPRTGGDLSSALLAAAGLLALGGSLLLVARRTTRTRTATDPSAGSARD